MVFFAAHDSISVCVCVSACLRAWMYAHACKCCGVCTQTESTVAIAQRTYTGTMQTITKVFASMHVQIKGRGEGGESVCEMSA